MIAVSTTKDSSALMKWPIRNWEPLMVKTRGRKIRQASEYSNDRGDDVGNQGGDDSTECCADHDRHRQVDNVAGVARISGIHSW